MKKYPLLHFRALRRIVFSISIAIICKFGCFGQISDSVQWAKALAITAPLKTKLELDRVSVPLVGGKFLPLVEVMINGKGPYRLLVDTGANITLLQGKIVKELGLRNLRPDGTRMYYVREIRIGKAIFSGTVVFEDNWDEAIDGIVGFNLYKDCLVTFDYPQQLVQFEHGELPVSDNEKIVDYMLEKRLPYINLIINNDTLRVLVDTGMAGHLDVNKDEERRIEYMEGKETIVKSKSFYFSGDVIKRVLKKPIVIGKYRIINSPIVISEEKGNRLGSSIFQFFCLTFDQKNLRIRFNSVSDEITIN